MMVVMVVVGVAGGIAVRAAFVQLLSSLPHHLLRDAAALIPAASPVARSHRV